MYIIFEIGLKMVFLS